MGSSSDAYGIFTRNLGGEEAGVGQGSEYRSGHLYFWKGRYFASVFPTKRIAEPEQPVFAIGKALAARIPDVGPVPGIVALLPSRDRVKRSIRYFHEHTDLNQHYFVADENILNLGTNTEAVLANYRHEDAILYLLVIRYPEPKAAQAAHEQFLDLWLPEAKGPGRARLEDGTYVASARVGLYLVAVFDAPDEEQAARLLAQAKVMIEENGRLERSETPEEGVTPESGDSPEGNRK
jgi:hypothetical protein